MKLVGFLIASFIIIVGILISQFYVASKSPFFMVFCNVGQGDGIYMRAFSEDIVIDGGPDGSIVECLNRHMSLFDRNIELMVVTHADSDHYAGFLDVLDSYTVTHFATSHGDSDVLGYQALLQKLEKLNVPIRRLEQGESIKVNEQLQLDILWPPKAFTDVDDDRNNSSLVMLLDYQDFEAILPGDVDKEYLNILLPDLNHIDIFKLSHHGSRTGTDEKTFENFRPELSIISAGKDNRFDHPHKEVIEALKNADLQYKTTFEGDIVITSNGQGFNVVQ